MEEFEKIWSNIKSRLQINLDNDVYNEHFSNISNVFKVINNYIYLIAPNSFVKNKIESFYLNRLNVLLNEYVTEKHMFKIITKDQAAEELAQKETYSINIPEKDLENRFRNSLNNSYTFENFVVGASNRLAYTSAMKVADQPGVFANPLYIFGDVGLGKTHLAHAIGLEIKQNFPEKTVLYVTSEQFTNQYIDAVKNNSTNDFIHFKPIKAS